MRATTKALLLSGLTASAFTGVHSSLFDFGFGDGKGDSEPLPHPSPDDDSCASGSPCPGNCFASATATYSSAAGGTTVSLPNCLNSGSATQSIAWGPQESDGSCGSCPSKATSVPYGASAITLTVPLGACATDICVWVYDTAYNDGARGALYLPSGCGPFAMELCHACGPYKVTVDLPSGTSCDDGIPCTSGDACQADGSCAGASDPSICVSSACATSVCDPSSPKANPVTGCLMENVPGVCGDGLACTSDVCVLAPNPEDPPVPPGTPVDASGCAHVSRGSDCCEDTASCPVPTCQHCGISQTCEDDFNAPSCVCPPGSCRPCEERCKVRGLNPDYTFVVECFDDDKTCGDCETAADCLFPDCQTCDNGFCVDDLNKDTCTCPDGNSDCKACEECVVSAINVAAQAVTATSCVDAVAPFCCASDTDCTFPACQTCDTTTGACTDDLSKATCVCTPNTCMDCEETCTVTSIDAGAGTATGTCSDLDGSCDDCTMDSDCDFPVCQTCDTGTGDCVDDLSKGTCTCPDGLNSCKACEECVVSTIDAATGTVTATSCMDAVAPFCCASDTDCTFPACQTCDTTTGACTDDLSKATCVCTPNTCMDCEETCTVTSIDAGAGTATGTCSDPDGSCDDCTMDSDCDFPACQTCDTGTGDCVDDLDKAGCDCPAAHNNCKSCEECVVSAIDASAGSVMETTCVDTVAPLCCVNDDNCDFPACQTCDTNTGACSDALSKGSCVCTPNPCMDCEECTVTAINAGDGTTTGQCTDEDNSCPPPDGCTNLFEVVCYKCGDNPLDCLVLGDPTGTQLSAIEGALEANCAMDMMGMMMTCADQQCGNGILVTRAPEDVNGDQCIQATGMELECPCVPNSLSNLGRYQVCLDDGAELITDGVSCDKICEESGCTPSVCPYGPPICKTNEGDCPRPGAACDTD